MQFNTERGVYTDEDIEQIIDHLASHDILVSTRRNNWFTIETCEDHLVETIHGRSTLLSYFYAIEQTEGCEAVI